MDRENRSLDLDDAVYTDAYVDALSSLESGYLILAHDDPSVSDGHIDLALERLIQHYQRIAAGRPSRPLRASETSHTIFANLAFISEVLLGHRPTTPAPPDITIVIEETALTYDELIACLKRIRKSIRFWVKQGGGRRSYIEYVLSFLQDTDER